MDFTLKLKDFARIPTEFALKHDGFSTRPPRKPRPGGEDALAERGKPRHPSVWYFNTNFVII